MNKAELITALAEHLDGDRRSASAAVDGLLDVIVRTVQAGDSVSVTGFGVFEQRQRAARSGRNPRTGQTIQVPATVVPAFRPGTRFRNVVSGARELGAASLRPAHPTGVGSAGRPPIRPVKAATAVAAEERPAKASGKADATKADKGAKHAAKDAKAAKSGKDRKGAKDGAKAAKASAGKSGKKKGKK